MTEITITINNNKHTCTLVAPVFMRAFALRTSRFHDVRISIARESIRRTDHYGKILKKRGRKTILNGVIVKPEIYRLQERTILRIATKSDWQMWNGERGLCGEFPFRFFLPTLIYGVFVSNDPVWHKSHGGRNSCSQLYRYVTLKTSIYWNHYFIV